MERSLRAIMDIRAQMGSKPGPYASARLSPSAGGGHADWLWARCATIGTDCAAAKRARVVGGLIQ